jgi:glycosyltransferase involved in cell wall biosynthesis
MNTNFSVLISLYKTNDPVFFEQAMASIFEQTYPPTEVVLVIDGEKTDAQQKVIDMFKEKYPQVLKVIPLAKNIGQGPALNEGLKHCSYELVARMDTDDICKPTRFEKQVRFFEQNPQVDVLGSWIEIFYDNTEEVANVRTFPETHEEVKKRAQSKSPIPHPCVMLKKSKVMKCGGYELLGLQDDYVLWMKMLYHGAIFHNLQEILLSYRISQNMFKRRGGISYAMDDCKLQWMFYRRDYISLLTAIRNIFMRVPFRIIPVSWRTFVYKFYIYR